MGGLNLREIARGDGCTNTVCLIEVNNSGIHWLEPRDLPRPLLFNSPAGPNISSAHAAGGANVAMADGSVRFISNKATARELRALTSKAGKDNRDLPRE
jgi:prepilin-type processing-associated H-X9-DG protein